MKGFGMVEIFETNDYTLLAKLNEEIQTLHHQMQPNIFKPYNYEKVLNFFKTTISAENVVAYIAKDQETIIGYVLLFKIHTAENPFQYARSYVLIDQIFVSKNYQGKGIGKLLIDTAVTFAKASKIEMVELNHWTLNDQARRFFIKHKFEYYNEKMWRIIDSF